MRLYTFAFFATLHLSYALAYPLLDSNTTKEEIKGDIKTHTLQSVVTTATGKEHLQKDAPASITIITQEEIESKPHKDLTEVLSGIPLEGVWVEVAMQKYLCEICLAIIH